MARVTIVALLMLLGLSALGHPTDDRGGGAAFTGGTLTGNTKFNDDIQLICGTDSDFHWVYDSASTQLELNSTDCDGVGGDCTVIAVPDGGDDVFLPTNGKLCFDGAGGDDCIYTIGNTLEFAPQEGVALGPTFRMTTSAFVSLTTGGPSIVDSDASATTVTLAPAGNNDANTGLGSAAFDQLSMIAGGVEGIRITEAASAISSIDMNGPTIFQDGSATAPGVAFSDNNSGIWYDSASQDLEFTTVGFNRMTVDSNGLSIGSNGPRLRDVLSYVTPSLAVSSADTDTGVGRGNADQLSLMAGGQEAARFTESGAAITSIDLNGPVNIDDAVSFTRAQVSLGAAATTFSAGDSFIEVTGDAGSNTIATITGAVSGQILKMQFVDSLVTFTDNDAHAADTIDLTAPFTSSDDMFLELIYDGTSWYEVGRSQVSVQLASFPPKLAIDPGGPEYATIAMRGVHDVIAFDDTTVEEILFSGIVPRDYASGDLRIDIEWVASTATTGAVVWGVEFEAIAPGGQDIDANGYAAQQSATSTTNATAGVVTRTTLTLTNAQADSIAPGIAYRVRVERLASDAADTMTGDAQIIQVGIRQ